MLPPPPTFQFGQVKNTNFIWQGGGQIYRPPTPAPRTLYPVPCQANSELLSLHTHPHTHTHSHTHTHKHTYIQRSYYFRVRIADDSNLTLYPVIMEKNSFFNCISYTVTFASTVHFIFINVLILYAFQEIERKKKQLHKDCGNLAIRRARQGSNLFWFVKF